MFVFLQLLWVSEIFSYIFMLILTVFLVLLRSQCFLILFSFIFCFAPLLPFLPTCVRLHLSLHLDGSHRLLGSHFLSFTYS